MASARFLDPTSIPLKRQSGGNIWATLVTVTQGVTVLVALSGLLLFFLPVIHKTWQYQRDQANLRASIENALAQQQQIRIETEHMKTDPDYVEHIARDRLQMGKEGEEIVHFAPYQAPPPASRLARPTPQDDSGR
jgi:cell division protein DivIC